MSDETVQMLMRCLDNGTKTLSELEEIAARHRDLAERGHADLESDFYQSTVAAIEAAKVEDES